MHEYATKYFCHHCWCWCMSSVICRVLTLTQFAVLQFQICFNFDGMLWNCATDNHVSYGTRRHQIRGWNRVHSSVIYKQGSSNEFNTSTTVFYVRCVQKLDHDRCLFTPLVLNPVNFWRFNAIKIYRRFFSTVFFSSFNVTKVLHCLWTVQFLQEHN